MNEDLVFQGEGVRASREPAEWILTGSFQSHHGEKPQMQGAPDAIGGSNLTGYKIIEAVVTAAAALAVGNDLDQHLSELTGGKSGRALARQNALD